MSPRARDLAPALALAALTQLACALLLGGRLHPDETHQYLEVAHRWVWGYGTRPHEWHSGMRNVVAPGLVAGVLALARAAGLDDPRAYVGLVHALVGAASLAVVACAYDVTLARTGDRTAARATALALALWAPWQNAAFRTLGETFSTVTLALALGAWESSPRRDTRAGAWLALGFVFRYPAGVYLAPFAVAYALRRDARGALRWALGAGAVLVALGAVDLAAWGRPWHSVLAYADYNLLRDRARIDYGARPWWFYLALVPALGPAAWLASAAWRSRWRDGAMALAVAVTYLAVMSALAHKEPRFFLPVIPPLIVAAGCAMRPWTTTRLRVVLALCAAQSVAALAVYRRLGVCEGDAVRAAEWVGRRSSVGAVALVGVSHPGYAHLHRHVPVYGDARNDVGRSLAMIEREPPPREGDRYAICRGERCERELMARGWSPVRREGDVAVLRAAR